MGRFFDNLEDEETVGSCVVVEMIPVARSSGSGTQIVLGNRLGLTAAEPIRWIKLSVEIVILK